MWLHSYHPSPILISFGPFAVHWYGLLLVVGGILAYYVSRKTFQWAGMNVGAYCNTPLLDRLLMPLVVGGFIGARLYHVLNEWSYYAARPLEVFAVWKGGLAIHGAIVGGLIALWWFIRHHVVGTSRDLSLHCRGEQCSPACGKTMFSPTLKTYLFFADLLVPGLALAQAIGRWGNYFNQELYGRPTGLAWGIPVDLDKRVAGFEQFEYFHPTFLYESVWLFMTFIILFCLLKGRVKPTPACGHPSRGGDSTESPLERGRPKGGGVLPPGRTFFLYLLLAGLGRFFIEFLRIDPMPEMLSIRLQQLVSAGMVVVGVVGLWWISRQLTRGKIVLD